MPYIAFDIRRIRMMRQIYGNSQRTLVWLGEATEETILGFDLMPQLLRGAKMQIDAGDTRSATELPLTDFEHYYGEYTIPADAVSFLALSLLPWFRRVWVIQEVSVSRKATLVCGSETVDWNDFVQAVTYCIQFRFAGAFDASLQRIKRMDLSRHEIRNNQEISLEQLLFRYRDFDFTLPSDKIYGLLGLVDDSELVRLNLEVDYSIPALILYRRLAIEFLRIYRNLDILGACQFSGNDDRLVLRGYILARIKKVGRPSPLPHAEDVTSSILFRARSTAMKVGAVQGRVQQS
ncbi:hypothetical protein DL769_008590 [Monosporascus sp. CRB-8-3]|nr:hypothetical protein DL769_008590 [Monosporascus sp. CRB-8-3]